MHPLDGIRLKVIRAQEHLDAIFKVIEPMRDGKFRIISKYDPDSGLCRLTADFPKVAPALSVIIGDCLHNMRSSLDHLIWQLVINNGRRPSKANQFPISNHAIGFKGQLMRDRLCGVHLKAKTLIDALQPYRRGQPDCDLHPLWALNELANLDKHRTLALVTVVSFGYDVDFKPRDGTVGPFRINMVGANIADGADIIGIRPEHPPADISDEMDVDSQGSFLVTLQDPPTVGRDVRTVLQEILDFVRQEVSPRFEPFFN